MKKTKGLYTIRQVIDLTGVSEFLLRVWENRYNAFKPKRTLTGRRLYKEEDVLRAKALWDLTHHGYKIKSIAQMSFDDLKKISVENTKQERVAKLQRPVVKTIEHCLAHRWDIVQTMIWKNRKSLRLFLIPLVAEMNRLVEANKLSIAQEHIITALTKEALASIRGKKNKKPKRMVFATPEGDLHDLGLMIASRIAIESGHHVLYLGANIPSRDLSQTCIRYGATDLVLATTLSSKEGAKEELLDYLHFLDTTLPAKVNICLAGRNSHGGKLKLKRAYKNINSYDVFEKELINA